MTFQNIQKEQPSKNCNAQFITYEEKAIDKELVSML